MTLSGAIDLIANRHIKTSTPQQWADLGAGNGLFSKALLSLLPHESRIYAIDKQSFTFTEPGIVFMKRDFEKDTLTLPLLNGIMMANSLHFVKHKPALLEKLKKHLLPGAQFLLVEYDTAIANRWVPYPLSYASAAQLFKEAGLGLIKKLHERQSVYNKAKIYSACIYAGNE